MTHRYLCIHGHFYQPPREDPITGLIPPEPGAAPYKNWNEKIHAECYRPNAELGNFGKISFNVGPTLCEWMEDYDPTICSLIVAQDRANVQRYGVGNAIAQSYNHTILPLASPHDKVTQVRWGIEDFKHRFGRAPQGMWLPETAVDMETLEVLADNGIEFTILAPWQAEDPSIDTTEPYRVPLSRGRSISVFFYDGELSGKVSFDPVATSNADIFATADILTNFSAEKTLHNDPQMVIIATDGELYGHHQKFRDRFLARLVDGATAAQDVTPIYPALWLKQFPPRKTVSIREKTSWSCHHGVSRWMSECGCTPGDARWKYHLRHAFDHLTHSMDQLYQETVSSYVSNPWELRHRYIQVVLGQTTLMGLLNEMSGAKTMPIDVIQRLGKLLEAERVRQRIYTSCGWYFEDFARIEPKLVVTYAAQAVRLVRQATGVDFSPQIIADLKPVTSLMSSLTGDSYFQRQMDRLEEMEKVS